LIVQDAAPANQSVYLGTNNFYYGPNTSHAYYTPNPWDNSNDSAAAKVCHGLRNGEKGPFPL